MVDRFWKSVIRKLAFLYRGCHLDVSANLIVEETKFKLNLRGSQTVFEMRDENSLLYRRPDTNWSGWIDNKKKNEYWSHTDASRSFRCHSIIRTIDICGPRRVILYREQCWGPAIPSSRKSRRWKLRRSLLLSDDRKPSIW